MPEQKIQTSAGMETASETVARARALLASGTSPSAPTSAPQSDTLLQTITERLTKQARGISTSSSSALMESINEAISGTRQAGELTSARLQSERQREMNFAGNQAVQQLTGAREERTGWGSQMVAFRNLVETTDKSLRDLDSRYQEAIMANDAATANTIAGLKVRKLEFLQQQEENFFNNMISVAGLRQQELGRQTQSEQFWASQQQQERQFMKNLEQSESQFQQNLALQYKNLDLQAQELDIQRERNQISWAEFNMKRSQINQQRSKTSVQAIMQTELTRMAKAGVDINSMSPVELLGQVTPALASVFPNFDKFEAEDIASMFTESLNAAKLEYTPPAPASSSSNNTGVIPTLFGTSFRSTFSELPGMFADFWWRGNN